MQSTGTIIVIILVVVLLVLLLGGMGMMGFGGFGMGPGMMGGMMGGYGFNPLGGILSLVFSVLVIGGIVWLVVWLVRGGAQFMSSAPSRETPLDILKARYARGEITKEQVEQMKKDLGGIT